jgi:hypothetical protein
MKSVAGEHIVDVVALVGMVVEVEGGVWLCAVSAVSLPMVKKGLRGFEWVSE